MHLYKVCTHIFEGSFGFLRIAIGGKLIVCLLMTGARFLPLKFLYTLSGPISVSVIIRQMCVWGGGGQREEDK